MSFTECFKIQSEFILQSSLKSFIKKHHSIDSGNVIYHEPLFISWLHFCLLEIYPFKEVVQQLMYQKHPLANRETNTSKRKTLSDSCSVLDTCISTALHLHHLSPISTVMWGKSKLESQIKNILNWAGEGGGGGESVLSASLTTELNKEIQNWTLFPFVGKV